MINWVEGLKRALVAQDLVESVDEVVETIRRYFVAHEVEVVEVDYTLGLRQRVTLLEEKVAVYQGHLTTYAAELGRLGSDMLTKAGQ